MNIKQWLLERSAAAADDEVAVRLREAHDRIEELERPKRRAHRRRHDDDLSRCPRCGGPADNGHDRVIPPSAYLCSGCVARDRSRL